MTKEQQFLVDNNPGSELREVLCKDGTEYYGETSVMVLFLPKDKKGSMVIDSTNMEVENFDKNTLAIRKNRYVNGGKSELICYAKREK